MKKQKEDFIKLIRRKEYISVIEIYTIVESYSIIKSNMSTFIAEIIDRETMLKHKEKLINKIEENLEIISDRNFSELLKHIKYSSSFEF